MKIGVSRPSCRKGYLAALAVAVLISAMQFAGGSFSSKSLRAAVIGEYGYTSNPVNYQAKNFFCYPGPIQTSGTYAGTYNTYYYSYAEGYTNSGVQGNWCQNYSTRMGNPPKDANNKYIVTVNGQEDTTNVMYLRWLDHKNAAAVHENKVVFYENSLPGYSSYYVTGVSYGGGLDPGGSGLYGGAVVHCPDGARPVDHTTTASQYRGSSSSRHYGSSPSDSNGMYDGDGHKWCERESDGVVVNPLPGFDYRGPADYVGTDRDKLFKFEFPDGTIKYTSYKDSTNSSSSGFVKCPDGASAVGPFATGNQYTNQYWVKEAGKRDYYRCFDSSKGLFLDAVADSTALPSPYNTIGTGYFRIDNVVSCDSSYTTCQPSCVAGSSTCGGANTVGPTTQACASNTYWCQTTDVNYRYCSSDPACTATEMTPPPPTWTIAAPTNLTISPAQTTSYYVGDSLQFNANFAAAGTGIPFGTATVIFEVSDAQGNFTTPSWSTTVSTNISAVGSALGPINHLPTVAGTYDYRIKVTLGSQTSPWTVSDYPIPPFTVIARPTVVCGNNICDSGETAASCAVDCGSTTACNNNGVCNAGESYGSCPGDCSPPAPTCNNNNVCDSGETLASCPTDCSTSNPSACNSNGVCETGESTGSCPSDCTSPPPQSTCDSDRICEANETAATCPTDCGSNPDPITGPRGCAVGETCSVSNGDWCNSGRQCFGYSNGAYTGNFTCNTWSTACDPATTRICPANDPNCIEPGSFGSSNGNCRDAMECYAKDGTNRKYCQPSNYNTTPATAGVMTCPASVNGVTLGSCSPNSPDCVEPNATRTANLTSAWCAGSSVSCYSADETTLFCQPITGGGVSMTTTACPAAYPNKCRPGDRYCTEAGETNTESGAYCMNGGNECWSSTGLFCPLAGASCPTGSGVCRAGSVGCIEPGNEGPIVVPGSSGTYSYCGGRSISCYKSDGLTMSCQAITNPNDPFSWERTTCPTGSSKCRPDDQYCCEIGETCSRGSWCTSGMRQEGSDGTVTCVASDSTDVIIVEPPLTDQRVCIQVTATAYNPTTLECKNFATPCDVPAGWLSVEGGKVCTRNGLLVELDVVFGGGDLKAMIKIYEDNVRYLTDLNLQLMYLTTNPAIDTVKTLIVQGLQELETIKPLLAPKSVAKMTELKEKLREFHENTLAEIEAKMAEVRPFIAFAKLRIEVNNFIGTAKVELSQIDPDSEYFINLSGVVKKLEELLHQGESQIANVDVLEHVVELIADAKAEADGLIYTQRGAQKDLFLATFIDSHLSLVQVFNLFVADKEVTDMKVTFMLGRFEEQVNKLKDLYTNDGDYYLILQLTDEVKEMRMRLERWLAPYGYRTTGQVDMNMLLGHIDVLVQEKVAELFKDLTAIIDETIQDVVVRFAEIVDQVAEETVRQIVTSVNNIVAIAVEDVRNDIAAAKDSILQRVAALNEAIENSELAYFSADRLHALLDYTSTINWCGDVYQSVQADINSAGLAIETGEVDGLDIDALENDIYGYAEDNVDECYRIGAANFRMPTHAWYFPYAEYNYSHGYIKGYTDNAGNRTGAFGEADATLRIEALTMAMRLFGIPVGSETDPGRSDVPSWAYGYYNGAVDTGVDFDSWVWNTPITRVDSAKLLLDIMLADDKEYVEVPTDYTAIDRYPDRNEFASDNEAAAAVEIWTDLEVFQGAGDTGKFNPYSYLLRSEFAAVVQRIDETLGVSEEDMSR